jgi:hypothetical protein
MRRAGKPDATRRAGLFAAEVGAQWIYLFRNVRQAR